MQYLSIVQRVQNSAAFNASGLYVNRVYLIDRRSLP